MRSNSEIIDFNYYCFSCKDEVVQKYNPFKHFESKNDPSDPNDDISKISVILENCQAYTANELNTTHVENLKTSSSSYFLNIDGNKSNFNSLMAELQRFNHNFSVIGLAETNIGPEESTVYALPNYKSFYQDKQPQKSKGTGVALYVLEKLNTELIEPVSDITENLESLFVTVRNNSEEATFGVIYRPPNGNFPSFISELTKILEFLPKKLVYTVYNNG